jgi:hypothetical protein
LSVLYCPRRPNHVYILSLGLSAIYRTYSISEILSWLGAIPKESPEPSTCPSPKRNGRQVGKTGGQFLKYKFLLKKVKQTGDSSLVRPGLGRDI